MTQNLLKEPLTHHFVRMKDAVQEILKEGFRYFYIKGVIDYKVTVLKADPIVPTQTPAVCINRTSDSETNQSLGDSFGEDVRDQARDLIIRRLGTNFRETLELRIWTVNSDQRDLLYSLVKVILFNFRHQMAIKYGLVNQAIVGGRDEADHVRYKGHFMYWGVVTFQAENSMQSDIPMKYIKEVRPELTSTHAPSNVIHDGHHAGEQGIIQQIALDDI